MLILGKNSYIPLVLIQVNFDANVSRAVDASRNFMVEFNKALRLARLNEIVTFVIQVQIRTNTTIFFKLQLRLLNPPLILGTRNNRNGGSETRTINCLSLVNHEQDWAAISDRGDTDIHDFGANPGLSACGFFNATNASLNLNFALGLIPAENSIANDGAYDLGVDFVDVLGWF